MVIRKYIVKNMESVCDSVIRIYRAFYLVVVFLCKYEDNKKIICQPIVQLSVSRKLHVVGIPYEHISFFVVLYDFIRFLGKGQIY